jgi:hypothetical protein
MDEKVVENMHQLISNALTVKNYPFDQKLDFLSTVIKFSGSFDSAG